MVSLFGKDCITKTTVGVNVGLVYEDSAYTTAGSRVNGVLAGEQVSALLINTVLRQTTLTTYILLKTIYNILGKYCNWTNTNLQNFDNINSANVGNIINGIGNKIGISEYLNKLQKIIDGSVTVKYCQNYDDTDNTYGINSAFNTLSGNTTTQEGNVDNIFNGTTIIDTTKNYLVSQVGTNIVSNNIKSQFDNLEDKCISIGI